MDLSEQETPLSSFAQAYGQAGIRIFPVYEVRDGKCACGNANCRSPAKHPRTRNGCKDATTDLAQIEHWWRHSPGANIGIATGGGLVVIDVDGPEGEAALQALQGEQGPLPETATAKTSRGRHLYFRTPKDRHIPCSARDGLDVRGDGGFVVAPFSQHISGHVYEWGPTTKWAEAPTWLLDWVTNRKGAARPIDDKMSRLGQQPAYLQNIVSPEISEQLGASLKTSWSPAEQAHLESALAAIPANQHDSWVKVGMALKDLDWQTNEQDIGFALWVAWSETCPEKFALAVCEDRWRSFKRSGVTIGSVYHMAREHGWSPDNSSSSPSSATGIGSAVQPVEAAAGKAQEPAQQAPAQKQKELGPREKLLRIGLSAELWHDKDGNNFATIDIRGHRETYTLKGSAFKNWLIREYMTRHKITINGEVFPTAPNDQAIKEANNALAAIAAGGAEHQVAVRVAGEERSIYIDLGTPDWSVVEVSADGWRVLDASPMRFARPPGLQPLPVPTQGGNIRELRRFLNLRSDDFVLIVAWLLAALRPVGPYPVLIVNGEHGAGKTLLCRVVRRLVDPNSAELRSDSRNERDLFLAANNGRIVALDNLSYVRNDLSDAICRIATTGAFATRALYTDGEEFFVQISRPVLLNGIPPLASRPDLADRAIVLNLPAIPETNRRSEEDFWIEFGNEGSVFLGAILDGLSGAMRQVSTVELQKPPRMIDFAKWGEAGWRSLGLTPGAFEEIYTQNRAQSNEDALDADPVAISILRLMANKSEWIGTAAQLLSDLGPGDRDWLWPKNATQLGKHLRRLPPLLRQRSLEIEFDKAPNATRSRLISLKKTKESSVHSVQASTFSGK